MFETIVDGNNYGTRYIFFSKRFCWLREVYTNKSVREYLVCPLPSFISGTTEGMLSEVVNPSFFNNIYDTFIAEHTIWLSNPRLLVKYLSKASNTCGRTSAIVFNLLGFFRTCLNTLTSTFFTKSKKVKITQSYGI